MVKTRTKSLEDESRVYLLLQSLVFHPNKSNILPAKAFSLFTIMIEIMLRISINNTKRESFHAFEPANLKHNSYIW